MSELPDWYEEDSARGLAARATLEKVAKAGSLREMGDDTKEASAIRGDGPAPVG